MSFTGGCQPMQTHRKLDTQIGAIQKDHFALNQMFIRMFPGMFAIRSFAPRIFGLAATQKPKHSDQ